MIWIKILQYNPANTCCKWQFLWITFLTSSPVTGFLLFWGSLIPYKTRPAPVPLTPRFPHREEKRCEIHHHHQAHQEMADILQKEKKKKNIPPHHQIRVCHIHAYSQSSTLTLSAPPRRAGTQQTLNPALPTAGDNKGEREETAPPVMCWSLCPGFSGTWEDAVGTLGRQSLWDSWNGCIHPLDESCTYRGPPAWRTHLSDEGVQHIPKPPETSPEEDYLQRQSLFHTANFSAAENSLWGEFFY